MAAQRMAAVVVREVGGISKLLLDSGRAIPAMARDQVLVRNAYAGLNMYVKYEKQQIRVRVLHSRGHLCCLTSHTSANEWFGDCTMTLHAYWRCR